MLSDLEATAAHIEKAKVPEDVFGNIGGLTPAEQSRALLIQYRRVVQVVHPDKFNGTVVADRAREIFVKLTEWKTEAERKIEAGTYGDRKPTAPPKPPPPAVAPQIIKTPRRTYTVTGLLAQGDLADLYNCTYQEGGKEQNVVFKVAQSPADNDLLENESKTLGAMYPEKQPEEKFYRYLPKLLDTFILRGPSGTNRRVNVLQRAEGYVTMAEVIRAYPKGLDYRDMVWMFKRSLAAIGYVHLQKHVVHGALIPSHIMVHPTGHGAKIVDWCYAVRDWEKRDSKVKALSSPWRDFYAPEIIKRHAPTPQTDLYMLGKCCVALLGGDVKTNQMPPTVPKQIQAFLGSCLLGAQGRRPDDAWKLHEEFDELLVRLVGKSKYRPLSMPAK